MKIQAERTSGTQTKKPRVEPEEQNPLSDIKPAPGVLDPPPPLPPPPPRRPE